MLTVVKHLGIRANIGLKISMNSVKTLREFSMKLDIFEEPAVKL